MDIRDASSDAAYGGGAGVSGGGDAGVDPSRRDASTYNPCDGPDASTYDGDVYIQERAALTILEGVACVRGNLAIVDSTLRTLEGLEGLQRIEGDLDIVNNPMLRDISALSRLEHIGGDLWLQRCEALESLHFSRLRHVGDAVMINLMNSLQSLEGLPALEHIGVELSVFMNASLETLRGLDSLERVAGMVDVAVNPMLREVGLPHLRSVGKGLGFRETALRDLSGLDSLWRVGSLFIQKNDLLETLDGLEGLERIEWIGPGLNGNAVIQLNPRLVSVAALRDLQSLDDLVVEDNPSLSQCEVSALADGLGLHCRCERNAGGEHCGE